MKKREPVKEKKETIMKKKRGLFKRMRKNMVQCIRGMKE